MAVVDLIIKFDKSIFELYELALDLQSPDRPFPCRSIWPDPHSYRVGKRQEARGNSFPTTLEPPWVGSGGGKRPPGRGWT